MAKLARCDLAKRGTSRSVKAAVIAIAHTEREVIHAVIAKNPITQFFLLLNPDLNNRVFFIVDCFSSDSPFSFKNVSNFVNILIDD